MFSWKNYWNTRGIQEGLFDSLTLSSSVFQCVVSNLQLYSSRFFLYLLQQQVVDKEEDRSVIILEESSDHEVRRAQLSSAKLA